MFTADTRNPVTDKELVLIATGRSRVPAFVVSPSPVSTVDGANFSIAGSINLSISATIVGPIAAVHLDLTGSGFECRSTQPEWIRRSCRKWRSPRKG